MENHTRDLQFKTNINCGGCVATIKPFLDKIEDIQNWEVNTADKNKILTINANKITKQEVIDIVEKAGFKIEALNR